MAVGDGDEPLFKTLQQYGLKKPLRGKVNVGLGKPLALRLRRREKTFQPLTSHPRHRSRGDIMTHSLHRCGKMQEKDFVWLLYHVKGVNDANLVERLRKAIAIIEEVGSVNWGDVKSGPVVSVSAAEIKEKLTEKSRIRGAFTSRDQVTKFLKKMKEADLGFCVIISGLLDQVFSFLSGSGSEASYHELLHRGLRQKGAPGR